MDLTFGIGAILVISGVVVGIINTFAGAGASITLALYSMLGVDLPAANATNRISVITQTFAMSSEFMRQGKLDIKVGLKLSVPTILGSIGGSFCVGLLSHTLFGIVLSIILFAMLLVLIFNPTKALKSTPHHVAPKWYHYALLLAVGFYGGAFHIGIGYIFLWLFIAAMGYDFMEANALKGFVVLPYTIISFVVFIFTENIVWHYGLLHAVGTTTGTYLAAHYSDRIPKGVLRYALMVFITFTICYILIHKL